MILKQMAHETGDGVHHPNSVWRLVGLLATTDGVKLTLYGYHDLAAYNAGARPLMGAVKEYTLPATTISDYPELETAIHQAAWAAALATLEGSPPEEGQQDNRHSFFEEAESVA
jgi:hypothetical protein